MVLTLHGCRLVGAAQRFPHRVQSPQAPEEAGARVACVVQAGRKVRTPGGSTLGNTQPRQREGKCHRKHTARRRPTGQAPGKGEKVG